MSIQTISMESLYANGMGIELPISNNDTKQTQESYPCSSIIDIQSIENDLSYLNTYELLEKHNTNDMIKLHNKLNKEYGKHNKSLESYLDTRIKSMEENKLAMAGKKIWEWIKVAFSHLIKFVKSIIDQFKREINMYIQFFKIMGQAANSKVKFEMNKNKTVETKMDIRNYDTTKHINDLNSFAKLYEEFKTVFRIFLEVKSTNIESFKKELNTLEQKYSSARGPFKMKLESFLSTTLGIKINWLSSENSEDLEKIKKITYNEVMSKAFEIKVFDQPKDMKIKDIYKNSNQFTNIILNNKNISKFMLDINRSMSMLQEDFNVFVENIGKQLKSIDDPSAFQNNKIFKQIFELSYIFIHLTRTFMQGSDDICKLIKSTFNIIHLKEPETAEV